MNLNSFNYLSHQRHHCLRSPLSIDYIQLNDNQLIFNIFQMNTPPKENKMRIKHREHFIKEVIYYNKRIER